jgi:hypothetical protein
LLHALCIFLGASLLLLSVFFCFACFNKWLDHIMFVLERDTFCYSFSKNTLVFTLIVQRVFSFFGTAFSFHFLPWFLFRSYFIFASRCIWTSGPCCFSSKELFRKGLNGVGKEKKFHTKKVVQKGVCLDRDLDFCMSCLIAFW